MSKTNPIDPSVPAGTEDPKLGDNRIRALAAGVIEEQNVDHYVGSDGGAGTGYNEDAAGEHKKVTLREQSSKPSAEANKGYIYTKAVSGVAELFYEDENGNEIQITTGGILNSLNLTGIQTAAGVKTLSSQLDLPAGLTAAAALVSTLATGTPPLTIASTTKVSNLNADQVDGYDVSAYAGGESHTFPGGLIIKQGNTTCSFKGSVTSNSVSFGTAFPNSCVRVVLVLETASIVNNAMNISAVSKSASGFTIDTYSNNTFSATVGWIAIGY